LEERVNRMGLAADELKRGLEEKGRMV